MCLRLFGRAEYHCHPSQRRCLERLLERHGYAADVSRVAFRRVRVVRREGPAGWVCRYAAAALRSGWRARALPGPANSWFSTIEQPAGAPSARSAERLSAPSRADRLPRRTGAARRAQPVVAGIGLVRADSPPGVRPDAPRPEPALLRAGEIQSCATCARFSPRRMRRSFLRSTIPDSSRASPRSPCRTTLCAWARWAS